MGEQKRFPWLAVGLGAGCVGILCIGVLVVGGGAALFLAPRTENPIEAITTGTTRDRSQHLDAHSLFDDFSSDGLGWPRYDDGTTLLDYEDQAYSFQVTEPAYYDWVYFPGEFIPYEIQFDARAASQADDGTFGVFCQFQDEDNYYYVEFDIAGKYYLIGQVVDGTDTDLTSPVNGPEDGPNTDALNPPTAINHIGVSCNLDSISLTINGKSVADVRVQKPFDQPGPAAFFVYVFEDASEKGYKVYFDNVEAHDPQQ
jgi:hypothetical protein